LTISTPGIYKQEIQKGKKIMASSEPLLGSIAIFAGNFAPRGYQLCQGQLLSIAQNTALFSILGTTYGGNGQTTFALPDLRGRFPVGQGPGPGLSPVDLGEMAGNNNVTILTSNMPAHTHPLMANNATSDAAAPANNTVLAPGTDGNNPLPLYSTQPPNTTLAPQSIGAAGGGQPVNVANPYLGINFIIAVEGIFPSRN
jgi:microcystin-dependent protein